MSRLSPSNMARRCARPMIEADYRDQRSLVMPTHKPALFGSHIYRLPMYQYVRTLDKLVYKWYFVVDYVHRLHMYQASLVSAASHNM